MKTYKRIDKICGAVSNASKIFNKKIIVADIGTDHGYVAEKLSKYENIEKVIATDISEKSLNKLNLLIKLNKLNKIETSVGDGLIPVEKADICVIAGMGGLEITKIIDNQNVINNKQKKCNIFVLQPAQNIVELRLWAINHHYKIIDDFTFEDAERFYSVLVINVSKFELNRKSIFNLWLGKYCKKDEDFIKFIHYLDEYLSFMNNVSRARLKQDKILSQKYKLRKLIKKYLNK
ncbi:MAG: tRNA (adenine(22)-N(1))-methyltransferase TrmK [Clostridia bacterium]|nr:tRNA (adenine(22)-N(1))-methyltransferase TrmK [Clostridia bacterium]